MNIFYAHVCFYSITKRCYWNFSCRLDWNFFFLINLLLIPLVPAWSLSIFWRLYKCATIPSQRLAVHILSMRFFRERDFVRIHSSLDMFQKFISVASSGAGKIRQTNTSHDTRHDTGQEEVSDYQVSIRRHDNDGRGAVHVS
jgi:hypothetical protein